MVSWSFAFRKGAVVFLWSIVWGIIGGIVAIAISGGAIFSMFSNPSFYSNPSSIMGAVAGIFVGALLGGLIAAIGSYATIIKVTLESLEERRAMPGAP